MPQPLTIATQGDLAGHAELSFSVDRLNQLTAQCVAQGVSYHLGAKAADITQYPPRFHAIDCSGFARVALYHCTEEQIIIPDGSWVQGDWFRDHRFKPSSYQNCSLHDDHVRVCIARARPGVDVGHIWFVVNGVTSESWGHHGPGHRAFNTPVLARIVSEVYVLC